MLTWNNVDNAAETAVIIPMRIVKHSSHQRKYTVNSYSKFFN